MIAWAGSEAELKVSTLKKVKPGAAHERAVAFLVGSNISSGEPNEAAAYVEWLRLKTGT